RNLRGSIQEGAGADKPCCNCSGGEAQQGLGTADIRDSGTMNETAGGAARKLSTAAAPGTQTTPDIRTEHEVRTGLKNQTEIQTEIPPETQAAPETAPASDARLRPLKLLVPFVMGHRGRVAAALVA